MRKYLILTLLLVSSLCLGESKIDVNDAVRSYTFDGRYLELRWGLTEPSANGTELFITVHESRSGGLAYSQVKIYRRDNPYKDNTGKLQLLESITPEILPSDQDEFSRFSKPLIRYIGYNQFIVLHEQKTAKQNSSKVYFYAINPSGPLIPIDFKIDYDSLFSKYLTSEHGSWKGPIYDFTSYPFKVTKHIWKNKDAICCPTAGALVGSITLKKIGYKEFIVHQDWVYKSADVIRSSANEKLNSTPKDGAN